MKNLKTRSIVIVACAVFLVFSAAASFATLQDRSEVKQVPQPVKETVVAAPENGGDVQSDVTTATKQGTHDVSYEQQGEMMKERKSERDNLMLQQETH
jgi:hypothetical protein